MKLVLDNFTWGMVGEPYQIPCLRLTVNGLSAHICPEKFSMMAKGFVHVVFDEFQWVDPIPNIFLPKDKDHNSVTLEDFVQNMTLARMVEKVLEAEENGTFEPGRKLDQEPIVLDS